jgi:capsular exopolysaccharide synthesis family protein
MMEATPDSGGLTLLDYLRPVWRFKFIVVLVVILAAAATYVYTNRKTKIYQTSTQLYVGQSSLQQLLNPGGAAELSDTNTIADQALLLTTPTVARVVRANLRLTEPPQALLGAIQAAPSATTDFVTITATSTNPALAARLADGFAQAYIQVASGNLVSNARSSLRANENQLQNLAPGSANLAARAGLRSQISTLEGIVSTPPSVGRLLAPANVPGTPVSPRPTRDAIFAAAIALVLAVILSYLFDRGDRRVRRLEELESLFALPVLATVPHVRSAQPTAEDPYGTPPALRERFRSLRVSLDLARSTSNGTVMSAKVILVTSALPAEGKSTVVRNLAISYREAGLRIAVVEADLRRPVLADQLGLKQGPGLSEALAEGGNLALQRVPDPAEPSVGTAGQIDVAVAGTPPEDPTVLLTEARVKEIITHLASDHDIVLIDSPPLLAVSDGLPLLGMADGTLLVVRAGTVTRPAAARLLATIERVNRIQRVHMLGIVANDVVDDLAAYYGDYGNSYGGRDATKSAGRSPDLTVS